ncbi:GPP34 family phosphoprotein [Streptomyces sp. NBC_00893]|uniref:GOLPH3/VPS74 family protein n=1 Tax=Streptomyces sp. NBC_00893 TaxID=2975862 RepID=UPI002255381B|nr:GPP34 family phosphoprotein [Streptomyces sp. NBC_00893]MCX4846042.1 GPP34 family phosphoprotein [Streptomyces sp. NBC_00893]
MTPPAPELTLPEELLLLALDPLRGKPQCSGRFLSYATAGAVLRELEFQGRVTGQGGRTRVVSPLAPPDPFLAQVLGSLSDPGAGGLAGGVATPLWIRRTAPHIEELCLEHLVRRSLLRRETHRLLGLLVYHRHPAVDPALTFAVRDRFTAAEAAGFPDPRSRTLAALVSAIGLSGAVSRGGLRGHWAMRGLVDQDWAADAVHRNVRRDRANRNRRMRYSSGGGSSGGD